MENQTRDDLTAYVKSKSKSIALIYSPVELHEYIVEILSKNNDSFIHKGKKIRHFHSLKEAMMQATEYGAEELYLCADNTYDECGAITAIQTFDYIPLHSPKQAN
ncbi:hypothetical protein ACNVED_01110 [Legionella sp. D16C41]|uniref:hypothetical protein n=1 Tax=Legionella sp. D16C41 TaxID=3402688 RepID=UPI003AF5C9DB